MPRLFAVECANVKEFPHMIGRFVLAAAFVAATFSSAPPAAADDTTTVYVPPFYESVAAMAPVGKLGSVIKEESISTTIPGARAWRIAYISSDQMGKKTIATGIVVAPAGAAPKDGRPVVAWAHGTTGTAQNCGPSQEVNPAQPLNEYFLIGGNSTTDYGLPAVQRFINDGYVVVGTDYQGQGGGGNHQYMVTGTQAHDLIDSIRAAGDMKEVGAGKKAVIYGWSQGGGAVLTALSLPEYIAQTGTAFDGIELVGAVGLAPADVAATVPSPPTDEASAEKMLAQQNATFGDNVFQFAHLAMTLWALPGVYRDLHLTDVFTPEGAQAIDRIMTGKCVHSAADTINYVYGASFMSLMNPQATNALAWSKAIIASSVPNVKPVAPIIIYWGTADVTVPPVMGELYRKQMCAMGANVARVQLPGSQTHYTTPPVAEPLYVPWVEDRFAGKPAQDGCAAP
jgi:pimeloyl-ACP methyl ester carboxylesterase